MNSVTLIRDGSIVCPGRAVEGQPLMYLGAQAFLEEGYTLRGYFSMLEKYPVLTEINPFLPSLLGRYRACSPAEGPYNGEEILEFAKTVEMIGFPGRPRLEIFNTFRYIRNEASFELKNFQLESLLDPPIRMGSLRHIVFGDKVDTFDFKTVYNLFEFIDGIAWELSFHGTPVQCALRR